MKKNFFSLVLLIFSITFQKSWSAEQSLHRPIAIHHQQLAAWEEAKKEKEKLLQQYKLQALLLPKYTDAKLSNFVETDTYFENPLSHNGLHDRDYVRRLFAKILLTYNKQNHIILRQRRDIIINTMTRQINSHLAPDLQTPFMNKLTQHLDAITLKTNDVMQSSDKKILVAADGNLNKRIKKAKRNRALMPNPHDPAVQALTGDFSAPAMPHFLTN